MTLQIIIYHSSCFSFFDILRPLSIIFRTLFGVFRGGAKTDDISEILSSDSFLTSRVNCPSPWTRQNFPAPLKIEQILFHR